VALAVGLGVGIPIFIAVVAGVYMMHRLYRAKRDAALQHSNSLQIVKVIEAYP
jgi:hypothetical protein